MIQRFAPLKARNYQFRLEDGSSREVLAIYAGNKRVCFMEYDTAYDFVNRVHDLTETHEHHTERNTE